MRLGTRSTPAPPAAASLVAVVLLALLAVLLPSAVGQRAGAATASVLQLSAPAEYADRDTTLTVALTDAGLPIAGAPVTVERWSGTAWQPVGIGPVLTDGAGSVTLPVLVDRSPTRNLLRATYPGDSDHTPASVEYTLPLNALPTTTVVNGSTKVIDEQGVYLRITWKTIEGTPISGPVSLQQYVDGAWRSYKILTTDAAGTVRILLRPRVDTLWRGVGKGQPWVAQSYSATHAIDNLPPGVPVVLPAASPKPRVWLPAQPRGTGAGPHADIHKISDAVWRSMVGRSWHRGCPVGRSGLRLLRINYWDFRGYRRRGEIVAAASVIRQISGALSDMYRAKLPIRSMYRVDRFGWSSRVNGADDYKSMASGNTSAFNCRWVVGNPGVRSPHAYGRAFDVNTWENPYRSRQGWVPNTWWPSRSDSRVAWRARSHAVVRIMAQNGLRWTYGTSDSQHFDAVPRGARLLIVPGCGEPVCH
ncbi:MAG: M15 family metallopeptidase [Propionibacteriales bacterium]|nr:M15 family metallopeptidase [Propionibacteriales bacterium]